MLVGLNMKPYSLHLKIRALAGVPQKYLVIFAIAPVFLLCNFCIYDISQTVAIAVVRLLAKMFPKLHFDLIDPRPFSRKLEADGFWSSNCWPTSPTVGQDLKLSSILQGKC